jgi:LacI family transcriptional regulator
MAEFTYVRTPENHAAKLHEVLESLGDKLDGVLTMGTCHPDAESAFAGFAGKGVPVVFVGTDAREQDRLCCVRTYDEMAGRMAADLLINFASFEKHSKIVMTGDFAIPDQFYNAQGFEKHIFESGAPLEILKLSNDPDLDVVKGNIRKILDSGLDIRAVYATSSRNTVPMCQAIAETGRGGGDVRVIGSDIFPESIDFLRRNVLNALIHKRPSDQAYQAMQTLINVVVKGEGVPHDTIQIDSVIVMKSNLECFLHED